MKYLKMVVRILKMVRLKVFFRFIEMEECGGDKTLAHFYKIKEF